MAMGRTHLHLFNSDVIRLRGRRHRPRVFSPAGLDSPRCACNVDGWWTVGGGACYWGIK